MYEANSFTGALDGWDIGSVSSIGYFANGATITTDNYDALLVSWEGQSPFVGLTNVNFGNSTFSLGTAADTARASLVSTYNWTITDGGGI